MRIAIIIAAIAIAFTVTKSYASEDYPPDYVHSARIFSTVDGSTVEEFVEGARWVVDPDGNPCIWGIVDGKSYRWYGDCDFTPLNVKRIVRDADGLVH